MRTYAVSPTRSRRRQDAPPGHFLARREALYGLSAFRRSNPGSLAMFASDAPRLVAGQQLGR